MKVALIGYGKMGHAIEEVLKNRKDQHHKVVLKITDENIKDLTVKKLKKADVAIEFTSPSSAYENILKCFEADVPVVCGSTGWLDKLDDAKRLCLQDSRSFFYAPNFSIGVNIFFAINERLAQLMNDRPQYEVEIEEIHHTEKKDAPSGTAIHLADKILEKLDRKKNWISIESGKVENKTPVNDEIPILSKRETGVPGTHIIKYTSAVDSIEVKHTAFSRMGFAEGAVLAAEWVIGKRGYFEMKDLLNL